jgi:signal transduction histidine kinase
LHLMEASIDLDEDQTVAIFRIVQESLTNVTRHAKASRVDITLSQNADDVIVEVRDDGKGFDSADAARKKSFGLLGMRERAAVLGGNIDITSVPRQGTVVSVRIPIKRNERIS